MRRQSHQNSQTQSSDDECSAATACSVSCGCFTSPNLGITLFVAYFNNTKRDWTILALEWQRPVK